MNRPFTRLRLVGKLTEGRARQSKKTVSSMVANLELPSKMISERSGQLPKQNSPIVSTDEGMEIEQSDKQSEKVHAARTETLQSGANDTFER
jgi:hypothetical protein